MSRFSPVCRCRVNMMSGYSSSRCRGQMRPDCVDRAIRNVGTEHSHFDGRWRQHAPLKCWRALLTDTRVYNPEDHNLNTHTTIVKPLSQMQSGHARVQPTVGKNVL